MDTTKIIDETSFYQKNSPNKNEKSFNLSLSAQVSGINSSGKEFEERSVLLKISAQEACFYLKSKVKMGTRLNLTLYIPKTLILEKNLNLCISGNVSYIKPNGNERKNHLIQLHLDKSFKILQAV
jgi:Tfp pilus assembly protein PilZ